ncbi:hypothetical protein [Desulfofustis limnaeus]|jgi:hypothetical protein|uniref:Methionine synthase n=1 Tax=Desulfofustis limnaeus TaxID=2740163 RepID=A0ABM7WBC8_9BACT|nr:hypothetical protein [Desulfofustis limnaeus]MDX9894262.1 hypothetical protein [Desulfofustis sp.]BDD88286.1 hypothetical protein DPPLL_26510 [Desulfofustis limnaeus]
MEVFTANALPVLVGSMPHKSHRQAVELIFSATPSIPIWPQLPANRQEGMLRQFLPGMPGVTERDGKVFIDTAASDFETHFLHFFEQYLAVEEGAEEIDQSRFTMSPAEAAGFFAFLEEARLHRDSVIALKGQITGPITFCTGLVDQDGRAIFYNEQLRDAAVKHLALKARWQTSKMAQVKERPLLFFDEPGLAGFGSSAFITITPADIATCFSEVIAAVHGEGGLAGVHVCANTEWPVIFDTAMDIVNYDAYSYFDRLLLYPDHLVSFLQRGGILASGIVPTAAEHVAGETAESLADKWFTQTGELEHLGLDARTIFAQTLITPSCGTGTLSESLAEKVLSLTAQVSMLIRDKMGVV